MATAVINGVLVTGSVDEIYTLIQRATGTISYTTSTTTNTVKENK